MKKDIFVYEKNKDTLAFLKKFFNGNSTYKTTFFTNVREFKKASREDSPDCLVVGAPECMDRIEPDSIPCPVIAMVDKDVTKGMRSVVKNDLEFYLLAPFNKSDLAYKLKTSIRKEDYLEALCQDKEDLETISDLTYHLSSTLDPEEVLYIIVKKLSDLIPVSRCSILSVSFGEDRQAKVVSTFESPSIKHITLDIDKYPEIEKALKTKQSVVVKDAMKDPLMNKVKSIIKPLGIKSIVVIPIIFRDEVIGTLFLRTSRKRHNFTPREVRLCQNIAVASANALNNAFLFERVKADCAELKKLAITDFLTGVYNIRYFYHRLSDEFSRSSRYKTQLCCIMFDIDFFKRINDTYGHRTGDMVLREFATLANSSIRKSDVLARYGGEEFIMLLPHTTVEGAKVEAERLANTIRGHKFKGIKTSSRITVSIGISSCPRKDVKRRDDLINQADDALLKAKKLGRDRIVVHR